MQSVKSIPCARCGMPAPYSAANPWRPFCSERCRLIDLGNWAAEKYRVPDKSRPPAPEGDDA